jgi:hypothetical protein
MERVMQKEVDWLNKPAEKPDSITQKKILSI